LTKGSDSGLVSRLERTSRALEILTVALVILVSPLSFVLGLPFGISPESWLAKWEEYAFIFVVLAIAIALVGFAGSFKYRVRARAIRRSAQKS
jgi:membrane protein YdbS with pleckstrin-like domain